VFVSDQVQATHSFVRVIISGCFALTPSSPAAHNDDAAAAEAAEAAAGDRRNAHRIRLSVHPYGVHTRTHKTPRPPPLQRRREQATPADASPTRRAPAGRGAITRRWPWCLLNSLGLPVFRWFGWLGDRLTKIDERLSLVDVPVRCFGGRRRRRMQCMRALSFAQ